MRELRATTDGVVVLRPPAKGDQASDTAHTVATVLIDKENERSLALAARIGFTPNKEIGHSRLLTRPLTTSSHQSVEV